MPLVMYRPASLILFLLVSAAIQLTELSRPLPVFAQEAEQADESEDAGSDDAGNDEAESGEDAETGEQAAPIVPSGAPFMEPMQRLALVMGSMSFLRQLCGDPAAGVWASSMKSLFEIQDLPEPDRRSLIASYNSGYRGFASTYRSCTAAAQVAMERYKTEGATLARDIVARYGN